MQHIKYIVNLRLIAGWLIAFLYPSHKRVGTKFQLAKDLGSPRINYSREGRERSGILKLKKMLYGESCPACTRI